MSCRRTLILTALVSLLEGCLSLVPLPMPWPADKPRFTQEQLTSLVPGTSTRDSIAATLGSPSESQDFVRSEGRYWTYTWIQNGAGRYVVGGGPAMPFSATAFGLFLTFDERGVLTAQQLIEQGMNNKPTRICSSEGVCITHPIYTHDQKNHGFHDPSSAFTLAQQSLSWEPPIGQCRVVLWLDGSNWTDGHGGSIFRPEGVYIDVGPERAVTSWLPVDAYVVLSESPGEWVIKFRNPEIDAPLPPVALHLVTQDVPFACDAGRTYYVALGASSKDWIKHFGVVWQEVRADGARGRLQGMSELVLPDGSSLHSQPVGAAGLTP